MRTRLVALAATAVICASALPCGGASAQGYPARAFPPPPRGLTLDEIRDYERDQLDRRQEMERAALRMHQKAERRARGLDDDD